MAMEITRKELEELYTTLPVAEVLKRLGGINPPRLYLLLDKAGIPRKMGPRNPIKIKLVD
jgi:hypothetical protein